MFEPCGIGALRAAVHVVAAQQVTVDGHLDREGGILAGFDEHALRRADHHGSILLVIHVAEGWSNGVSDVLVRVIAHAHRLEQVDDALIDIVEAKAEGAGQVFIVPGRSGGHVGRIDAHFTTADAGDGGQSPTTELVV